MAAATLEDAVRGADIVVLAAPPLTCLDLVDQLGGPLRGAIAEDCTITDVASAKTQIVARADAAGLPFIGGHPMAGRELSGYAAAVARSVRGTAVGDRARTARAARGRGADGRSSSKRAARSRSRCTPPPTTRAVAAISHMPLVVSAAIVEAVAGGPGEAEHEDWRAAEALAATGWAGMTRLARGEPSMGAGIAATNATAVAARLRDVRAVLDRWLADLEGKDGPDVDALLARFVSARQRLVEPDER